jgi:hypothetical protein
LTMPSDVAFQESAMRTQALGAGFEGLEERLLLAGNLTSALAAGVLVLNGDALDNQVQLTVASNGQLTATGLSGTTINGVASVNFGVVNTLTVDGGVGNDSISLQASAASITNNVILNGGLGDDTISVTGRFGVNLTIDGGDGNDKVTVSGSTVARDVLIQTGLGNDSVNISATSVSRDLSVTDTGGNNSFSITSTSVRNDTLMVLGAGNDTVLINGLTDGVRAGATAQGLISIDFGAGKNVLSMSHVKALGTALGDGILLTGGIGNDVFGIVDTQSAGGVVINTGDGANRVELARVQITGIGDLDITTGFGADSLKVDRVNVAGLGLIDTGAGNDILQITNSRFTGMSALLGVGDDAAYLSNNFYAFFGIFDGGAGLDALTRASNSPNNAVIVLGFEATRVKTL